MTTPPLRYAGFWIRVAAAALDTLFFMALLGPVSFSLAGNLTPGAKAVSVVVEWVVPAVVTLLFWHYRGATPGKLALGLRIVDVNTGGAPRTTHLVNRYLGYFVSFLVVGLGFLWVAWDKRKQGWHDLFADTAVIHVDAPAERKRWLIVIAIAVALAVVLGAVAGVRFFRTQAAGARDRATAAQAEGRAFGQGKKEIECLRAGLDRDSRMSTLVEHIGAQMFLAGCFESAERSPGFCADVPPQSELMRTTQWRLSLCESRGRNDPYCGPLLAAVQRHCDKARAI